MQIVQHGFYQLLVQNAVIIFSAQPDRLVNDCMVGLHTDIRICFLQQNLIIRQNAHFILGVIHIIQNPQNRQKHSCLGGKPFAALMYIVGLQPL